MKSLLLMLCLLFSSIGYSQSLIDVSVSSNQFTPSNIIIDVGDTVRWTNVGGFHNVNGTQTAYPNNPESFGNSVGGPGWVLTHVFTTPGSYDYHCDPHLTVNMVGTVTVNISTSIAELQTGIANLKSSYNPLHSLITITLDEQLVTKRKDLTLVLFNILGEQVAVKSGISATVVEMDAKTADAGLYVLQLYSSDQILDIVKQLIY